MGNDSVDIDRIVRTFIKMRDKKAEIEAEYKEKVAELNDQMDVLRQTLLAHCKQTGSESVRTDSGTFYRSVKKRYWTNDWESMIRFIKEHDAIDLMERRIHQGNMAQYLKENPDELPPGLNADVEYTVNVRRSKK